MKIPTNERKAISPIVATVLIVAATLIAFAAVAGYVFGIFGGASSTANVQEVSVSLNHACMVAAPANTCTITLENTGTAAATTSGGTITYGGATYNWGSATTTIAASSSSVVVVFTSVTGPVAATVGQSFTGVVSLSNGEQAIFSGTFA